MLVIASFNCDGLYSNFAGLELLFKEHNIILIQEHWLHQFEVHKVEELVEEFDWLGYFKTFDDRDPVPHTQRKRGHAGTAILWHTSVSHLVEKIPDGSNRITGIRFLSTDPERPHVLILSVYLPCRGSPVSEYNDTLYELQEIMSKYSDCDLILGGDFNGSLHRSPPNNHDIMLTTLL